MADDQYVPGSGIAAGSTPGNDSPVVVRRTRRTPFRPPVDEDQRSFSGITVSRSWGLGLRAANQRKASGLTRNRKIAGDLPEWAPLPPGELAIVRTASTPR